MADIKKIYDNLIIINLYWKIIFFETMLVWTLEFFYIFNKKMYCKL